MPNMGRKQTRRVGKTLKLSSSSLADALFSGTQQRVLGLLFGQPGRSFYATELIGLTGAGSGAVQRELARLAQSGLITVRPLGNQKHYQANPQSPLFDELCAIAQKTVGLAEPLRTALNPVSSEIHAAFVFGSIAKREDTATSDIDLMIISDTLSYGDVFEVLETASSSLGRTVNPTIVTRKELAKREKSNDAFISRVLSQPKIWLIGDGNSLGI
jgi:predicted nucleotidyltransferase